MYHCIFLGTDSLTSMPRVKSDTVDWDPDEKRVFIENEDFAELAGLSRSWICQAAKNDWLAGGMPVARWKVENRYGQTIGFDVPKSILEGLKHSRKYA